MASIAVTNGLFSIAKGLIQRVLPDKEKQAEAELELMKAQQNGELQELELSMSAIIAEANSSDPWTSRARPSFLYVMYIFILSAIPMGFLAAFKPELATAVAAGAKAWLEAIPPDLYVLFGAGYLGYAVTRSKDKQLLGKK